jgi:hypothetical protein
MKRLATSLAIIERRLAAEKGEFALFACLSPADFQEQWDLVVSAAWAPRHDTDILQRLVGELNEELTPEDRLSIGRVVIVEPSDEDVQELNARFDGEDLWEIRNEKLFGYLVAQGFILASHDYWRFVKAVFPSHAEFAFFTRDGDLHMRVSWELGTDPERPHKSSRIIIIRITHEALADYIYIDDSLRHIAEQKLVRYLRDKLRSFNPEHSKSWSETPPIEEWRVTTTLFERPAAMA